jgi:parallel beta-helix repeat protein
MQACMNAADPGDICNVHAGVYAENVRFKANRVTLQANHGDIVQLNGTIDILSYSGAVVDGFQLTGFTATTGGIHAYKTTGGIIRNNVVHNASGCGIYVRMVNDFKIYGNTIHDMMGASAYIGDGVCTMSTSSTDGTYAHGLQIYSNEVYQNHQDGIEILGQYVSVHDNYVHDNIYPDFASVHPDGIECNGSVDGTVGCVHALVYNNVVKNQNQNIYFNGLGTAAQNADIWIFNNVVFNDPASSTGVSSATGTSSQIILNVGITAYILNNTIGGTVQYFDICLGDCTGGNHESWGYSDVHILNNIIANSLYIGLWNYPSASVTEMDSNFYFNNSAAMVHWGSSGNLTSIAQIRSTTGMEPHGQQANPKIDHFAAPILPAGSPAIGAGRNLAGLGQTFLNTDKNGTPRPASKAWDVGAFSSGTVTARPNATAKSTAAPR